VNFDIEIDGTFNLNYTECFVLSPSRFIRFQFAKGLFTYNYNFMLITKLPEDCELFCKLCDYFEIGIQLPY
jgi:hypothetical protein